VFIGDKKGFIMLPALQNNAKDGQDVKEEVEKQVLSPGEFPDDAAAGTGDIREEVKKDQERIDGENGHNDKESDEA